MFRFLFILSAIFSIICCGLNASLFLNGYTHKSGSEIHEIKVCGERCSGTTFLRDLMFENFPVIDVHTHGSHRFGYKHFLWWLEFPKDVLKLKKLSYNMQAVTLAKSKKCLFIVIVRNPYDWIRSFYRAHHHVSKKLLNQGFFHFISSQWCLKDKFQVIDGYNPYTGKPFNNVLELRSYKMKNYLILGDRVDNFCLVRHEDIAKDPEQFVNFIANFYELPRSEKFMACRKYKPKKYPPFDERSLNFINQALNWEIEEVLGYFPN